jgi:formylglycine-generating enzyme required for sulfatase activity
VGSEDGLATDPLAPATVKVEPFLASRFEVTFAEYWEFLEDPRTAAEIALHEAEGLRFVPRVEGQPVVNRSEDGGHWVLPKNPERPVEYLSLFDFTGWPEIPAGERKPLDSKLAEVIKRLRASETIGWGYLAWRSERSEARARQARRTGESLADVAIGRRENGEREVRALRFSLPTVAEWERMARGGDRRTFVYGDQREWLAFKGTNSRRANARPEPIGLFPDDESPFGIRDLAGSVAEWTADWNEDDGLFWGKGSSWCSQAERARVRAEDDRVASRQAWGPGDPRAGSGFRVVVRKTVPID